MKGPGLRIDMDVRRIWRCAKCGKTTRTQGLVTAQRCGCSDESPWMRLEQPVKREPFVPPHRDPIPEYDDEPSPPAVPSEPLAPAATEQSPPTPENSVAEAPAVVEVAVVEIAVADIAVVETTFVVETTIVEAVVADAPAPPPESPSPAAPATEPSPPDDFGAGLPEHPTGS